MVELKKYDQKDGPAGSQLDLKAKIMSADLKISYSEAIALALQMDPDGAKTYIDSPNEVKTYDFGGEQVADNTALDSKAREYAAAHDLTYREAVVKILEENPELYQ